MANKQNNDIENKLKNIKELEENQASISENSEPVVAVADPVNVKVEVEQPKPKVKGNLAAAFSKDLEEANTRSTGKEQNINLDLEPIRAQLTKNTAVLQSLDFVIEYVTTTFFKRFDEKHGRVYQRRVQNALKFIFEHQNQEDFELVFKKALIPLLRKHGGIGQPLDVENLCLNLEDWGDINLITGLTSLFNFLSVLSDEQKVRQKLAEYVSPDSVAMGLSDLARNRIRDYIINNREAK